MRVYPRKIKIFGRGNQKLNLLHLDFQSFWEKKTWVPAMNFPDNLTGKIAQM